LVTERLEDRIDFDDLPFWGFNEHWINN
jgi:hypothetical protein